MAPQGPLNPFHCWCEALRKEHPSRSIIYQDITARFSVKKPADKKLSDEKTKSRELKALFRAMDETGVAKGTIVTYEDEEEIEENSKIATIIPALNLLMMVSPQNHLKNSSRGRMSMPPEVLRAFDSLLVARGFQPLHRHNHFCV